MIISRRVIEQNSDIGDYKLVEAEKSNGRDLIEVDEYANLATATDSEEYEISTNIDEFDEYDNWADFINYYRSA